MSVGLTSDLAPPNKMLCPDGLEEVVVNLESADRERPRLPPPTAEESVQVPLRAMQWKPLK